MLARWDAQREEVILIKLRKKLLISSVVGAAIILSAALIVSLGGNDKPSITTNPPAEEQPPASNPTSEPEVPTTPDDEQPGDGGDEPAPDEAKATGLARAYEVHMRNLDRMNARLEARGLSITSADLPKGLIHSTSKLAEKLGIVAEFGFVVEMVEPKTHGQGHGNAYGLV